MEIPEGFAQITHLFGGPGCPTGAACTYGVVNDDDTSADDLAEAAHTIWTESILLHQTDVVDLLSTICKNGPEDTGAMAQFFDTNTGGEPGDSTGPNTAYLVKKNTSLGGRHGRGRFYIPGVKEDQIDASGDLESLWFDTIAGDVQSFFEAWEGSPHDLVLLHSPVLVDPGPPPVYEPSGVPPTTITSLTLQTRTATQRRRLRR